MNQATAAKGSAGSSTWQIGGNGNISGINLNPDSSEKSPLCSYCKRCTKNSHHLLPRCPHQA